MSTTFAVCQRSMQRLLTGNHWWLEANHDRFEVGSRVKWVTFHHVFGWTAEIPIKSPTVTSSEFTITVTPREDGLYLSVFHQTHDQGVSHYSTLVFWKPTDGLLRLISADKVGDYGLWVSGSLQAAYLAWKTYYGYKTTSGEHSFVRAAEDVSAQEWMV